MRGGNLEIAEVSESKRKSQKERKMPYLNIGELWFANIEIYFLINQTQIIFRSLYFSHFVNSHHVQSDSSPNQK